MEVSTAFFVFGLMIAFLWQLKADFFLIVFGLSAYLFLLFFIVSSDPLGTLLEIVNFMMLNPLLALMLFITPICVFGFYEIFKMKGNFNKDNEEKEEKL